MASGKDEREYQQMRLILLGKTGSGKSATGNTILMKPGSFESRNSAQSVTTITDCRITVIDDVYVKVIDTPGFCDNKSVFKTQTELDTEIVKCIGLSSPGPHAFLYVVDCGRLTKEEIETAETILKLFSDDIFNFLIIVLVLHRGLDDGQTIDQYVDTFEPYFKTFLFRCRGRRLAVDNKRGSIQENNKFVSDLLYMVATMNNGQHYSNPILQNAQLAIENRRAELSRQNPSLPRRLLNEMIDRELLTGGNILLVLLGGAVGTAVGGVVAAAAATAAIGVAGVAGAAAIGGLAGTAGGASIAVGKYFCTIS